MGTPPSFAAAPDIQPTKRQEAEALADNPAALRLRIDDLERTRLVDAARIAVLEAQVDGLFKVAGIG